MVREEGIGPGYLNLKEGGLGLDLNMREEAGAWILESERA